jgi:hypothetical protein
MNSLWPRLEAAAGVPVMPAIDLNPAIAERIEAGETFDVGLTNPHYVSALIAANRIDGATHRPFGRVPLAIGCKAGGAANAVTDAGGIVALIRNAESIGYTGAGTSGRTYLDVMERLGLSETAASRGRPMGAGEPMTAVAAGEVELGVVPLTTVLSAEGVVPAAIFPDELGANIDISVFLRPSPGDEAVAILDFLSSTDIDADLAAAGLIRFSFDR